jgi:hypothetical protein
MKNKEIKQQEDTKHDLKHDSMEFSASTDGDDKLDTDDASYEEEGISAEELEILDEASLEEKAEALNSAETDREADEDNLPEEDWLEDLPDTIPGNDDDAEEQPRRK